MNRKRPYSQDNASKFTHYQLKLDKRVTDFERRAKEQPFLCADEAWFTTQAILRHLRQEGEQLYGADWGRNGPHILSSALEPSEEGRAPLRGSLGACTVAVWLVNLYRDYLTNYAAMKMAYQRWDIWGVRVANCVCDLYATMIREQLRSAFVAFETMQKRFPEAARSEALAELLVDYFDSQLNTSPEYRLGCALQDEQQALSDALPAEALAIWADRGQDELKDLRNRISQGLQQLGRESSFKVKVAGTSTDAPDLGDDDEFLEEFIREATLRQQLADMEQWTEQARLTEQQNKVRELDLSTNFEVKAIAQQLGMTEAHVRKVRYDYIQKLRKVAGHWRLGKFRKKPPVGSTGERNGPGQCSSRRLVA